MVASLNQCQTANFTVYLKLPPSPYKYKIQNISIF